MLRNEKFQRIKGFSLEKLKESYEKILSSEEEFSKEYLIQLKKLKSLEDKKSEREQELNWLHQLIRWKDTPKCDGINCNNCKYFTCDEDYHDRDNKDCPHPYCDYYNIRFPTKITIDITNDYLMETYGIFIGAEVEHTENPNFRGIVKYVDSNYPAPSTCRVLWTVRGGKIVKNLDDKSYNYTPLKTNQLKLINKS